MTEGGPHDTDTMADIFRQLAASSGNAGKGGSVAKPMDERPVLLVTTVDIGGGRSDRIEVRLGEEPGEVALRFCERHGLPKERVLEPLRAHLNDNLRKVAAAAGKEGDAAMAYEGLRSPHGPAPPLPAESPRRPAGGAEPGAAAQGAGSGNKLQYSFGQGMDAKAYEQLSSKLLDDSATGARKAPHANWVNASEVLAGGGRAGSIGSAPGSKRSSSGVSASNAQYAYGGGTKHSVALSTAPSQGDGVHDRLYSSAQDRATRLEERRRLAAAESDAQLKAARSSHMSWISAEMMRGRTPAGMYDNYGSMLYAEGVEALMSRLKKAEVERRAREERELDGLTFTPAITRKAWELKQRERDSIACSSMEAPDGAEKWQRLHGQGMRKSTQERLESLRQQREAAEVAECSFRPRINKNSDQLMAERAETLKVLNITHYEQLYADAMRRSNKMEELQQWYPDGFTFQPQVNKDPRAQEYLRRSFDKLARQRGPGGVSASVAADAGGGGGGSPGASAASAAASILSSSVVDRLYGEAERKAAKLEAARQAAQGPIDPVTQKRLFVPETGRGPRGGTAAARRAAGQDVGDYLYAAARDQQARQAAKLEEERRAAEEEASRVKTTATSQRMFAALKAKRFKQIFQYLDQEGTGSLDLLALLGRAPAYEGAAWGQGAEGEGQGGDDALSRHPLVDDLDPEVLQDVEGAASVWARANGLVRTPAEQAAAALVGAEEQPCGTDAQGNSLLAGPCPPLSLEMFVTLMEEALQMRRGPRAYLVPSPSSKQAPAHSFQPQIDARSKAIAARLRPDNLANYELLHRAAAQKQEKLEALRLQKEAAGLEGCTFQPQLNASSRAVEGRALSRAGTSASVRGSSDPSGFATAAANIAAAGQQQGSAAAYGLEQQLQQLRLAHAAAAGVRPELASEQQAGGGGVAEHQEVLDHVASEIRDLQAVTQLYMASGLHGGQQQQAPPRPAQSQSQSRRTTGTAPASGRMQELAAALDGWDPAADPTLTRL